MGSLALISAALLVASTTEFLPIALLPGIASDLDVSAGAVGQLVTVFAVSLVVLSVPLSILTRSIPPKTLLVCAMLGIAAAAFLSALAPTFEVMIAARVLGGAFHAVCAATTVVMVGAIVSREQMGRAVAITSVGPSLTLVVGIPGGAALAVLLGWRAVFLVSVVSVLSVAVLILLRLPRVAAHVAEQDPDLAAPPRWFRDAELRTLLAVSVLSVSVIAGQFSLYTYVTPWMTGLHVPASAQPALLLVFGGASAIGLVVVTPLADVAPRLVLTVGVLAVPAAVVALVLTSAWLPALFAGFALWGFAYGGVPGILQAKLMRTASRRNRRFAGALQAMGGNIGVAAGGVLGGGALSWFGVHTLPWLLVAFFVATGVAVFVQGGRVTRVRRAVQSTP